MNSKKFQAIVWHYYQHSRRDLPWRRVTSTYAITVSELMLQQTQVNRVIPKFNDWLHEFPSFEALAQASQAEVLKAWQGLGYNRRARYLHQIAQKIVNEWRGSLPADQTKLVQLPGIGWNTAGAICAYSFNQPVVFIETNIRSVFIHHFFPGQQNVDDKEILPLIEETLPKHNSRVWYWALMDYGTFVKKQYANPARAAKSYSRQSSFEGSLRQLRAQILRYVLERDQIQHQDLAKNFFDPQLELAVQSLIKDNLLKQNQTAYHA